MKKLLTAACCSLALLPLNAGNASAWGWPWKSCCGHCYDFSICCKQYNAFSPVCFGKMYCDGCCPSPCLNGYGPGPANGNGVPFFGSNGYGADSQFLGQLPPTDGVAPPTFNAPMPSPADGNGASMNQVPAVPPSIQSSGYRGVYPPGAPAYPLPTGANYWNGNRGY